MNLGNLSGAGMTGQPGDNTLEMDGESIVSYLARAPRVPSFFLV